MKNLESFAGTRFDQSGNEEQIDGVFGFVPSNLLIKLFAVVAST